MGRPVSGVAVILSSSIIAGDASNRPFNASHAADEATPCARSSSFSRGQLDGARYSRMISEAQTRRPAIRLRSARRNQTRMRRRPLCEPRGSLIEGEHVGVSVLAHAADRAGLHRIKPRSGRKLNDLWHQSIINAGGRKANRGY